MKNGTYIAVWLYIIQRQTGPIAIWKRVKFLAVPLFIGRVGGICKGIATQYTVKYLRGSISSIFPSELCSTFGRHTTLFQVVGYNSGSCQYVCVLNNTFSKPSEF